MLTNTKSWLAGYFSIKESDVEVYFKNEDVAGFLIIWTIFEQKLFGGSATVNNFTTPATKIESVSPDLANDLVKTLETEFEHFYKIYQDPVRFKNLIHKTKCPQISDILSKSKPDILILDKLTLLLFVTLRYRNNIFHGNKPVLSWLQYGLEIGYCVNVMKSFISCEC